MDKLIEDRNKINENLKRDFPNPLYKSITTRIAKLRNSLSSADVFAYKDIRKELRNLLKKRRKIRSTIPNPLYIKSEYVRYADD